MIFTLALANVAGADCSGSTPGPVPAQAACTAEGADCSCLQNVASSCQPTGGILDAFIKRGACPKFGAPLHPIRPRLSVGGTYQTFAKGEIANYANWTADAGAKMPAFVVSGVLIGDKIEVQWDSTSPFSYEFFVLRWDRDDHSENVDKQHEDGEQQQDVKTTGASGQSVIDATDKGIYVIYVEGCVKTGIIFKTASCDQGWSHPVYVDHLPALNPPVPIPAQPPPVIPAGILDIPDPVMLGINNQSPIIERLCGGKPLDDNGDHEGEIATTPALAQLQSVNRGWSCGTKSWALLRADVNDAIGKAKVVSQPGTDVPSWVRTVAGLAVGAGAGAIAGALLGVALTAVFGGLTGLLNYLPLIGAIIGLVTGFVLKDKPGDYDMRLTGLLQMIYRFPAEIDPTARTKLIDDLLTVRGPASERKDFVWISGVPTPALETENHLWMTESARYLTNNLLADRYKKNGQPVPSEFDNDANGMTDWVLEGLRLFLVQDFYELNSRPYTPLILAAIQNLADYSANGQFCLQVVPAGAPPMPRKCDVARAARNVLDFQATKFAVSSNELRRAAPFRRQPPFRDYPRLLTNGGDDLSWHYLAYTGGSDFLRNERDSLLMEYADGELMQALMPTGLGNDWRDFVRIGGEVKEGSRINTCVAPGFACGLNPEIPVGLPPACVKTDGDWTFSNFADNTPDCPLDFGFYAAVYSKYCDSDCDGRFGFFEATPFRSFSLYVAGVQMLNKG